MSTVTILPDDQGIDALAARPTVAELKARNLKFFAMYLKNWSSSYASTLAANGIGVIPIAEAGEQTALDGAPSGIRIANLYVPMAQRFGIPQGTPIIWTHDWPVLTDAVGEHFAAIQPICRQAGYTMGGYLNRLAVDLVRRHGVQLDLIWALAARSYHGGPHPDSHFQQFPSSTKFFPPYLVDPNTCKRQFSCWGEYKLPIPTPDPTPDPTPIPDPQPTTDTVKGNDDMYVFFNSDAPDDPRRFLCNGFDYRHITEEDWDTLNFLGIVKNPRSQGGVAKTTVQIAEMTDRTKA